MSRKRTSKYTFILKGVDTQTIHIKYGFYKDVQKTDISKLEEVDSKDKFVSFLDDIKKLHACNVVMIDHNTNKEPVCRECFWDHCTFESYPIGCPIKYIPSRAVKRYKSEITRETYEITQNITKAKREELEAEDNRQITIQKNEYYLVDGSFCSFNCCQAFIQAHKHIPFYKDSEMLLRKMYREMTGKKIDTISPAPHWRLLKSHYLSAATISLLF